MARSKQVIVVRGKPHATFEAGGGWKRGLVEMLGHSNRKGEQQGIQTSTYTGAPVLDPTGARYAVERFRDAPALGPSFA
jgi:hypothetical protein